MVLETIALAGLVYLAFKGTSKNYEKGGEYNQQTNRSRKPKNDNRYNCYRASNGKIYDHKENPYEYRMRKLDEILFASIKEKRRLK